MCNISKTDQKPLDIRSAIRYLMKVADDSTLSCHIRTMELSYGFPPADALIQQISKIEYKKHLNNLITVILTIAAVVYVLSEKFLEWYQNGGKDLTIQTIKKIWKVLTIQTIKKVWKVLTVCYTWVRLKGIPALTDLMVQTVKIYQDWKGLVTV